MVSRNPVGLLLLLWFVLPLAAACGSAPAKFPDVPSPPPPVERSQIIVLGDIDADEPTKKVRRFTPLADYLAKNLAEFGLREGKVRIARDIQEMGNFLKEGEVDVYFDSGFPTLAAKEISGSQVILRRWKQDSPEYWSTFIARRDSGIDGVEDFLGKVVAFEEPYSTSGFVLPAGTLIQRGFHLKRVSGAEQSVGPREIGYFFSMDEENTVELVLQGLVAGGGISNQDYQELPDELMDQLVVLDRTITVPRQLVSVRPGLDPALRQRIRDLLIGLDQTDEGRILLKGLKNTRKFDEVPLESQESLVQLAELMGLVSNE